MREWSQTGMKRLIKGHCKHLVELAFQPSFLKPQPSLINGNATKDMKKQRKVFLPLIRGQKTVVGNSLC
jgi:hypothetical protein